MPLREKMLEKMMEKMMELQSPEMTPVKQTPTCMLQ